MYGELGEALLKHTGGCLSQAQSLMKGNLRGTARNEADYALRCFNDILDRRYENDAIVTLVRLFDHARFTEHLFRYKYLAIEADNQTYVFSRGDWPSFIRRTVR